MHPDWLGNPQHFVAGFLLAALLIWLAPRIPITNAWVAAVLAVGVVMIGEAIVELVEYPLKYSGDLHLTAYFDTISDLANSLAGALVGSAGGTLLVRRRSRSVG